MNDAVWTFEELSRDCDRHYCMADGKEYGECSERFCPSEKVRRLIGKPKPITRPSEVRSDTLLAAAFADYWHGKWPNQTQEVKRLELSAHYRGCRDAFYAGAKAANAAHDGRGKERRRD